MQSVDQLPKLGGIVKEVTQARIEKAVEVDKALEILDLRALGMDLIRFW
jgi:hypothetical protein